MPERDGREVSADAVMRTRLLIRRPISMDVMEVTPTFTGHQDFLLGTEDMKVHTIAFVQELHLFQWTHENISTISDVLL